MDASNETKNEYWDTDLIDLLRRNALDKVNVLALLQMITDLLNIPEGELQRLVLFGYIWKAFGSGQVSEEFQSLKQLTYTIERTSKGYETANERVVGDVEANIAANRTAWRSYLKD